MADNFPLTAGSGRNAATDQVTHSGDTADVQLVRDVTVTGSEGSKTVVDKTYGAGAVASGTPRMTLASDDPAVASLSVVDDWDESDRAKVNPIAGQAGVAGGSGTVSALTQRVVLATDVALPAGTNAIGKLAANSGVDIGDVDVASVIAGVGATNLGKAIDDAAGGTDTGVAFLVVRDDVLGTITPAEGDYTTGRVDSSGALWCRVANSVAIAINDIAAGDNNIGNVDIVTVPAVVGEAASTMNATSSDGATALTSTAQAIKASAGTLKGYYIYNPNSTAQFVQFYNTASGSVTVGTTNPLFMLTIPPATAANLWMQPGGITFGTAMSWAATSTAGGNGAPTTALDAVAWYV